MRLVSAMFAGTFPFGHLPVVDDEIATSKAEDLQSGDMLVVWGGGDISPSFYNKPLSRKGGGSVEPGHRDRIEWAMMNRAKELGLPIIGVCRGAQMLCALAGGFLLQHVNKHGGHHVVETPTGYTFTTNSIHHQMMYPFEVDHEMLASIKTPLATEHWKVDEQIEMPEEPEFVYFPKVRGFAIQWHPEGMGLESPATQYIFNQILQRV